MTTSAVKVILCDLGNVLLQFGHHIAVFDDIFLSYEIGRRKPHKEIYDRAIRASGFDVSQVLYIDDREDLVAAARSMGIRSVVFRGVEECRQEIREMGIWPQRKELS